MTTTAKAQPKRRTSTGQIVLNVVLVLLILFWTIPTVGLLISSFRSRFDIQTSGWWSIVPHKEWQKVSEFPVPANLDRNGRHEHRRAHRARSNSSGMA